MAYDKYGALHNGGYGGSNATTRQGTSIVTFNEIKYNRNYNQTGYVSGVNAGLPSTLHSALRYFGNEKVYEDDTIANIGFDDIGIALCLIDHIKAMEGFADFFTKNKMTVKAFQKMKVDDLDSMMNDWSNAYLQSKEEIKLELYNKKIKLAKQFMQEELQSKGK